MMMKIGLISIKPYDQKIVFFSDTVSQPYLIRYILKLTSNHLTTISEPLKMVDHGPGSIVGLV